MCFLMNLFERKVNFESSPGFRERASAVVVGGVGGGVFIFVLDKIEVSPYDEVGGGRDSILEGGELGGLSSEARGVQVEVEGSESVCAVLGGKLDAQGISIEVFREWDNFGIIKGVNVGGDDSSNASRCFGKATVSAGIIFGEERLEKMIFPV